ncbi:MEFG2, partial [Symbiodinium sp. KB8]
AARPAAGARRAFGPVAAAAAATSAADLLARIGAAPRAGAGTLPLWSPSWSRMFSAAAPAAANHSVDTLRNIGISAHIDSGKTTLTERILFYTGRIDAIHDVRGKDGVGAKMDSMELEREKGITIQSAATYCVWGDNHINIIDTPGHVDFTVEVERALRVLDGAILVLCGVAGVQSQSITVDRQMKRYKVPRMAFINKLDRQGANPDKVIKDLRTKLKLNAVAMQVQIGQEANLNGVVNIVDRQAIMFEGDNGEILKEVPIPEDLKDEVESRRTQLIEHLADIDDEIGELFLMEEEPDVDTIHAAVRRQVIARELVPVFLGSAFKNRGVQPLLDAVIKYLPNPTESKNIALDADDESKVVPLTTDDSKPLVALAFKLEESRFGQLTYFRIYQGSLKKGGTFVNVKTGQRVKVPRLVRMHASDMEDVDSIGAGEIVATFGVDCASGDTFTDGSHRVSMESMFCPEPVISYSIKPANTAQSSNFSKALQRFQREDPTLRVHVDDESGETIMSGMGELHLDIYVERMRREYKVDVVTGEPKVNYRETVTQRSEFNYLHKKQTGGAGQFGRVIGHMEPMTPEEMVAAGDEDGKKVFEFVNGIVGNAIPPEYIAAVRKGFEEAVTKGALTGHPVEGIRVTLTDGQDHPVDSSEIAFRSAAIGAFRQGFMAAKPSLLEPVMAVELLVPTEFQGTAVALINKRKGQLLDQEAGDMTVTIQALVPLASMFGFSTDLRSSTQGKGEFSMEYKEHQAVMPDVQQKLIAEFQKTHKE